MSNVAAASKSEQPSPEPERERSVTVGDGRTLTYAEYGAPTGRPLLFLHGTPGSRLLGTLFDDRARQCGVRVLAPDRPGYGRSTPADGQTPVETAVDLAAVLDHAGVDDARVVGFSGGALSALALAATTDSRVTRVDVVSGAAPPSLRSSTPPVQRLLATLAGRTPRLLSGLLRGQRWAADRLPPEFVLSQYTSDGGAPVPDDVAAVVKRDFVEALAAGNRGMLRETRSLHRTWPVTLVDVGQPVRLWHGRRDGNAPLEWAERLADSLPDGRVTVFDDADHLGALVRTRERLFGNDRAVDD
jgi:pimeloyl-ACP methyl ester carboxylesterase